MLDDLIGLCHGLNGFDRLAMILAMVSGSDTFGPGLYIFRVADKGGRSVDPVG